MCVEFGPVDGFHRGGVGPGAQKGYNGDAAGRAPVRAWVRSRRPGSWGQLCAVRSRGDGRRAVLGPRGRPGIVKEERRPFRRPDVQVPAPAEGGRRWALRKTGVAARSWPACGASALDPGRDRAGNRAPDGGRRGDGDEPPCCGYHVEHAERLFEVGCCCGWAGLWDAMNAVFCVADVLVEYQHVAVRCGMAVVVVGVRVPVQSHVRQMCRGPGE